MGTDLNALRDVHPFAGEPQTHEDVLTAVRPASQTCTDGRPPPVAG